MVRRFALLASASLIAAATPAFAQEASSPADAVTAEDTGGIEEIIVTAQKRQERLQDVPVSVTALSAETIVNQRIAEFSDLTRAASSLTVTQQTSSPNNSIVLRGIGTFAFSIGVEPSVAVIVDDLPVVQQAQAFDNLSDISRIEVLKGPQGTLFGKSASAGVVNIVTQDPSSDLSGKVTFTAASDDHYRGEASVSIPATDSVGIRLTGFLTSYDGNIRNLTNGHRLNDQNAFGLRGKMKIQASDNLTLTLAGSFAKTTQDGTAVSIRSIDPLGTPRVLGNAALPLLPSLVGITPGAGNYRARVDADAPTTNKSATLSLKADLDLGFASLISVTGVQDWKFNFVNDVDGTDINVLGALTGGAVNGGIVQSGPYHSTNFTQELRLVSSGSGPFKYVLGGFLSDAGTDRAFNRGPVALLAKWDARSTSKSIAAFAQADYTLPTETTISAGVRFNHEKIGVRFDNLLANATAATCITGTAACRGSHSDDVVTYKASISQELVPDVRAYASYARGYKGFAYDVSSGFNPNRVNGTTGPVKAENSDAFEVGLKTRFLENRVQLNIAGFYVNYDNFQAQSAVTVNNAIQLVLNNVGKLRTKGVEAELSAKPADWLRIDASAAYTDAKVISFVGAQAFGGQLAGHPDCTTVNPNGLCSFQDRSGSRLPNSPKFKGNINATAEFPFGDDNKIIAIAGYQHQSKVSFDLLGNPLLVQKSYGIFNASLGGQFGPFRATAFVNNLFDKNYAANLADGFGTFGGSATNPAHVVYQFHPRDSERYFGIRVGYDF